MTPAEFLLAILLRESPRIAQKPERLTEWTAEVSAAVELDRKVTAPGLLVSPEVDQALVDSARWYEARLKASPKDGDCHWKQERAGESTRKGLAPLGAHSAAAGPSLGLSPASPLRGAGQRLVCTAIGPLQLRMSAYRAILGTPEAVQVGLQGAPGDAKAADLRDPETGVRAGYAGLLRWKRLCGGTPATWLTAWGWGRCPPGRTIDREAVRRCELASILLVQRGILKPEERSEATRPKAGGGEVSAVPKASGVKTPQEQWKCGHEGRKIADPHDARLLKWAKEKASP